MHKRFRVVALTIIGGLILQFTPMPAWAAEGSLDAIRYNPQRKSFSVTNTGSVTATFNAISIEGNKRLILDLENAEVGLGLPRDTVLLRELQGQWSAIRKVSVNQFGGARPVVRVTIDLVGDSYDTQLVQGRDGIELKVAPRVVRQPVQTTTGSMPSLRTQPRQSSMPVARTDGVDPVEYQRAINTVEDQRRQMAALRQRLAQAADKLVQIDKLRNEVVRLESELERVRRQSSGNQQGYADLETRYQSSKRLVQDMRGKLSHYKEKVEQLEREQQGDQSQQTIRRLQEATGRLESQLKTLRSENQKIYDQNQQLRRALEDKQASRPLFTVDEMKKTIAVLHRKYEEQRQYNAELSAVSEENRRRMDRLAAELTRAQDSMAQSVGTINQQNREIARLNQRLNELKTGLDVAAREQITMLNQKLETLEGDNRELRLRIGELTETNKLLDQQVGKTLDFKKTMLVMNRRISELSAENKSLNKAMLSQGTDSASQLHAMSSQITTVTKDNVNVRGQLQQLQTQYDVLLNEKEGLEKDLRSLLASGTTGETHSLMQNRMDELQDALAASAAERAMLKNTVKNLVSSLESANNKLKAAGGTGGSVEDDPQYLKLQRKNSQQQEQISNLLNRIRTDENKYLAAAQEVQSLRGELETARQRLASSSSSSGKGQVSELQDQIDDLQDRLRISERSYQEALQQSVGLKNELVKTRERLASASKGQGEVPSLQREIAGLQDKLSMSEGKYQKALAETNAVKTELMKTRERLASASQGQSEAVKSLQQEMAAVQEKLRVTAANYQESQIEVDALKGDLTRAKEQLATASKGNEQLTALQQNISTLEGQLRKAQGDFQREQRHSVSLTEELNHTKELLAAASKGKADLSALQGKIAGLQEKLRVSDHNYHKAQEQQQTLQSQLAEAQRKLSAASQGQGELASLQDQVSKLSTQLKKSESRSLSLRELAESLKTELGKTQQQLESASGAQSQVAVLQGQVTDLSKNLEQSNASVNTLQAQASAFKKESEQLEAQLAEAKRQLAEVSTGQSDAAAALQKQVADLQGRLKEASGRYSGLQDQVATLNTQLERAKRDLASASQGQTDVSGLRSQISDLESRLQQADSQYRRAMDRSELLQSELDTARAKLANASTGSSGGDTSRLERRIAQLQGDLNRATKAKENAEAALKRAQTRVASTSAPNSRAETFYIRGQELQDNGKMVEATVMFRDAYKLDPNQSNYVTSYAEGLLQTGNYGEATRILEGFVANNPYDLEAYNLLGKAHLLNGRVEDAQQAFSLAIPVSVLNNYATTLKKMGRIEEAERIFMTALSLNPNDSDLLFNLGNLYNSTNDLQKAKNSYEQALAIRPDFAAAHYNLGLVYSRLGERQNAVKHLRDFLRLSPNARNADVVRKYIQKLGG